MDYSALFEWSTLYLCTTQYYMLVLCYLSHTLYKCKGNSHITMITIQGSTIALLRSTVDDHFIKV